MEPEEAWQVAYEEKSAKEEAERALAADPGQVVLADGKVQWTRNRRKPSVEKIVPRFAEGILRVIAQRYWKEMAEYRSYTDDEVEAAHGQKFEPELLDDPESRRERFASALAILQGYNRVFLEEPFADADVQKILEEEIAQPSAVLRIPRIKSTAVAEKKTVAATPKIIEQAFYGLAGQIINKLRPNTESHPMGNLLELLTNVGNIVGPTAFYQIEDTKHYANLNVVTVGKSSKARKGTGQKRIEAIIGPVDAAWFQGRRTSGFGSGEAVIWAVRDNEHFSIKTKNGYKEDFRQGVLDKRLFVSESEFASILTVGGRKENRLSEIIRLAWDHQPIRNTVKTEPAHCDNPHISVSANITQEELLLQMREADRFNGFGNRFLWCYVERQALLPHGGDELDWTEEAQQLTKVVTFATSRKRTFMDRNAREMWSRMYEDLSKEIPGLVGAVTSRGEAQTVRLALIFSLLDCSEQITVDHLKAAKAVWDYCEESATFIFGGLSKEQYRLLQFLTGGSKTISRIRDEFYKRNRGVEEIKADVQRLLDVGRAVELIDESGRKVYSASEAKPR